MSTNFNSYIDNIDTDYWRRLCINDGRLIIFEKGDEFATIGKPAQYIGYIKSGTLKYMTYSSDGTPHVIGLEFAGEFVADYPFSLHRDNAKVAIVAESRCEIYCVSTALLHSRLQTDAELQTIFLKSTEALFHTVYDRLIELYTLSPGERYSRLITRHPDLFTMFSLKDIASYLNITPTHLSRLRKNIKNL